MAKLKLKTHSGAKKRFKLTKKTTKVTRGYRQPSYVDKTNEGALKKMLPYG